MGERLMSQLDRKKVVNQRPIFSGLRFLDKPEVSDSGPTA